MKKAQMVIETSLREGGTDPIFRIAGEAAKSHQRVGTGSGNKFNHRSSYG